MCRAARRRIHRTAGQTEQEHRRGLAGARDPDGHRGAQREPVDALAAGEEQLAQSCGDRVEEYVVDGRARRVPCRADLVEREPDDGEAPAGTDPPGE
jgi:hypothetical protein